MSCIMINNYVETHFMNSEDGQWERSALNDVLFV